MRFHIMTLFPEIFHSYLNESIMKRAIEKEIIEVHVYNIRDFSTNKHKKVDDYPFGGGAGMLIKCEPVFDAIDDLKTKNTKVIMLSPDGVKYNQEKAYELSKEKNIILLCGHYEGFDERINTVVDEKISIGDYVLTGGEIPAMAIIDSVTRLLPGVINEESHLNDSFNNDLLDYPQYTKPRQWEGMQVPPVLLSGHHKNIHLWQFEQSLGLTYERRPDLFGSFLRERAGSLSREEKKVLEGFLEEKAREERSMKAPCEKQNEEKGNP